MKIFLWVLPFFIDPVLSKLQKRVPIQIPLHNLTKVVEEILSKSKVSLKQIDDASLKKLALGIASGLILKTGLLETSCAISNQNLRFYRDDIFDILKKKQGQEVKIQKQNIFSSFNDTPAFHYENKNKILFFYKKLIDLIAQIEMHKEQGMTRAAFMALLNTYEQIKNALEELPIDSSEFLMNDHEPKKMLLIFEENVIDLLMKLKSFISLKETSEPNILIDFVAAPLEKICHDQEGLKTEEETTLFYMLCTLEFLNLLEDLSKTHTVFNQLEKSFLEAAFLEIKTFWMKGDLSVYWSQPLAHIFKPFSSHAIDLWENHLRKIHEEFKRLRAQKDQQQKLFDALNVVGEKKIIEIETHLSSSQTPEKKLP